MSSQRNSRQSIKGEIKRGIKRVIRKSRPALRRWSQLSMKGTTRLHRRIR
jgi:hypothetical protein